MHVSSPEAQEVVGEGECQADTDILGGTGSEAYNLTPDVMHIDDTHLGNVQRADHADHVSRADPLALAFGSSYKRRLKRTCLSAARSSLGSQR